MNEPVIEVYERIKDCPETKRLLLQTAKAIVNNERATKQNSCLCTDITCQNCPAYRLFNNDVMCHSNDWIQYDGLHPIHESLVNKLKYFIHLCDNKNGDA